MNNYFNFPHLHVRDRPDDHRPLATRVLEVGRVFLPLLVWRLVELVEAEDGRRDQQVA
jgi:hypothetical protein